MLKSSGVHQSAFGEQVAVLQSTLYEQLSGDLPRGWLRQNLDRVAQAIVVAGEQNWECVKCHRAVKVRFTVVGMGFTWGPESDLMSHLHHKDLNRLNRNRDNLEVRCVNCHALLHAQMRLAKEAPKQAIARMHFPEVH